MDLISKLEENKIHFLQNEPMFRHTTFRIGGNANAFILPENAGELIKTVKLCRELCVRYFILGRGSNVVFDDEGFDGAVISAEKLNGVSVNGCEIYAESGVSFTALSHTAKDNALSGLEFANGIPGAVGGAVYMNAGAYGGEVAAVLKESTYYDAETDKCVTITNEEHCYGYRTSSYVKNKSRIILSAVFELKEGSKEEIKAQMDSYMNSRRAKQPLEYPSAGSTFKRAPGHYTGQMIEELGLKGYSAGGAQISEKHAGFVINKGGATSKDVKELVEYIQNKVYDAYGVKLECEVIFVK